MQGERERRAAWRQEGIYLTKRAERIMPQPSLTPRYTNYGKTQLWQTSGKAKRGKLLCQSDGYTQSCRRCSAWGQTQHSRLHLGAVSKPFTNKYDISNALNWVTVTLRPAGLIQLPIHTSPWRIWTTTPPTLNSLAIKITDMIKHHQDILARESKPSPVSIIVHLTYKIKMTFLMWPNPIPISCVYPDEPDGGFLVLFLNRKWTKWLAVDFHGDWKKF